MVKRGLDEINRGDYSLTPQDLGAIMILGKLRNMDDRILAEKLSERIRGFNPILAITFLILSLFFISLNLTGFSILNATADSNRNIGIAFFVLGLIFGYAHLRGKRHRKKKSR